MKMTILEIDAQTQEVIERDPTAEELAQRELDQAEVEAKATAESERATAKAALLARLGITDDEAKLLLS
jgi:hypothetical protein